MLALASCQRSEFDLQGSDAEGPQKELHEVIITASIADGQQSTKTSYNEGESKN